MHGYYAGVKGGATLTCRLQSPARCVAVGAVGNSRHGPLWLSSGGSVQAPLLQRDPGERPAGTMEGQESRGFPKPRSMAAPKAAVSHWPSQEKCPGRQRLPAGAGYQHWSTGGLGVALVGAAQRGHPCRRWVSGTSAAVAPCGQSGEGAHDSGYMRGLLLCSVPWMCNRMEQGLAGTDRRPAAGLHSTSKGCFQYNDPCQSFEQALGRGA